MNRMADQKLEETSVVCHSPQDYNVFIVGYKGHGKSATMMNIIRDKNYKGAAGYKIEERTHEKCTFYDTPGFGSLDTSDSELLRLINAKAHAVGEVHAVLFVLRYWRIRSSVITLIHQLKDAFGPDYHRRTIIVFTSSKYETAMKLRDYLEHSALEFQEFVKFCEDRVIMLENSDYQTGETAASQIKDMITNRMHSEPLVVPWSTDTHPYGELPAAYAKGEHTNIVVVGKTGTGKSSTCNMLLDKEGVFKAELSPNSVTRVVKSNCANVDGHKLRLIDTPGLLEAVSSSSLEFLKIVAKCIILLDGEEGFDAFLFVINCKETPSQEEVNALNQLISMFSEAICQYMVVVATHKDELENNESTTESFKSRRPDKMKTILQKAGDRMEFINSVTQDREERRQYIEAIIRQVDAIARAHKGKKFSNDAINQARKKGQELRKKYPHLSEAGIQEELQKLIESHLTSQYWCFDGSSTVRLSNGSVTAMAKLSPGDRVLCVRDDGSVGFEEIFCFSHADDNCQTIYVHLETANGQRLLLSYGHYIHAPSNSTSFPFSLKAARDIRVGDVVFVYHPATNAMLMDEIVSTGSKKVTGAFCPHTISGTIIVNDILASCYADAVDPLVARKLLMPAWCLYKLLPLRVSAPVLKDGVSNTCKLLSATKQYLKSLY